MKYAYAKKINHKFNDLEKEICVILIKNPCKKSLEDFPNEKGYFC